MQAKQIEKQIKFSYSYVFKSGTICHIYQLKCDDSSYFVYIKGTYGKRNRFNLVEREVNIQSVNKKPFL